MVTKGPRILRVGDVQVLEVSTGRWLRRILVLKADRVCLCRIGSRSSGVYSALASLIIDKQTDTVLSESYEHRELLLIIASHGVTWRMRLVLPDQNKTVRDEAVAWLVALEGVIQRVSSVAHPPPLTRTRQSSLKQAATLPPQPAKPVTKNSSPKQLQRPSLQVPGPHRKRSSSLPVTNSIASPSRISTQSPSSPRKFSPIPISTYRTAHQAKLSEKERCKSLPSLESSAFSSTKKFTVGAGPTKTSYPRKGSAPTILIPSSTSSTSLSYEDFKRMFPSPPPRRARSASLGDHVTKKEIKQRGMAGLSPSSPHPALERASSPSDSVHSLPFSDLEY
ncbi:hypothetical protein BJ741DRAFT_654976 [Chytriomyces cf. hyalinus JEL632]|nr:hypothetical protein BJ741DRAFT_654976 [Chytriomyces cf. hyalinus JEL632]